MLHRLVAEQLTGANAPVATRVETITLDYAGTGPVHGVKTIDLNGISRTCAYDLNGNMVTSPDFTNGANPLNRAITYDADNMPTRIVHANGKTVDFVYDGVGKRTKKLVLGGKTVLYLGDHFEVENGVNIKYIFGGNLRLAQIKGSLTSYFHKDHLGSTAAVTDEAGQKKESTTYEPFGSTRTQEGTEVSAYKFTDQELDNETNLYNYDARLYDPVLGLFVTADSIVPGMYDPQSLNRYAYCRNNPLIYTDPSGHIQTKNEGDTNAEIDRYNKEKAEEAEARRTEINLDEAARNPDDYFNRNSTGLSFGTPPGSQAPRPAHWEYSEATGWLTFVDAEGGRTWVSHCYAGYGAGLNNPDWADVEGVGPIPKGDWIIGPQYDSQTGLGPHVMDLNPASGNNTTRTDFAMHGPKIGTDPTKEDYYSSHGCIIADRRTRDLVANSGCDRLTVTR